MSKGGKREGAGRKHGIPNKNTALIKDMIIGALNAAGGQEYLLQQSAINPVAFMGLVGKVLPTQITGDADNPIVFKQIERVIVDPTKRQNSAD